MPSAESGPGCSGSAARLIPDRHKVRVEGAQWHGEAVILHDTGIGRLSRTVVVRGVSDGPESN